MSSRGRGKKKTLFPKSVWDKSDLEDSFERHNISVKHIRTLWRIVSHYCLQNWDDLEMWVEEHRDTEKALLNTWPYKRIISLLREEFVTSTSTVILDKVLDISSDNDGQKFQDDADSTLNVNANDSALDSIEGKLVIRLQDGQLIETVIIQGDNLNKATQRKRLTVCVSSQVGCKMGCTFCETGE